MLRRIFNHHTHAAEWLLGLLLVLLPLSLGAVPEWTLWPLVLLSSLALWQSAVGAHRHRVHLHFHSMALLPALGALFCLLQLIPLPGPLLRFFSPATFELREFVLKPLGLSTWGPVTLDAPSTFRELAKHLSYVAVALTALHVGRLEASRRRILLTIAMTGSFVAVLGLLNELFSSESLFGVFQYSFRPPLLSTFGNPNHLAGYLILSTTLCLGLFLTATRRHVKLGFALAYLVSGAALVFTLSRAGLAFFVFAQLLLGAWVWWRRRSEKSSHAKRLSKALASLVAVASVLAVAAYVSFDRIMAEWELPPDAQGIPAAKWDTWPDFFKAGTSFWLTGMGRGAFEWGFPRFQTESPQSTFTHPENILLQGFVEWGFLASVLMGLVALVVFYRFFTRSRWNELELSVLAAATGLVLHNLFDFNMEFAACTVTLTAMVGVILHADEDAPLFRLRFKPAMALWGTATVLALVSAWAAFPSAASAEATLLKAMQTRSPTQVREVAQTLIQRHPSHFALYDRMGQFWVSKGRPKEALAWANRALFLRPLDGHAHLVAASALLKLNQRSQAFLEFRLAYESGRFEALDVGMKSATTEEEFKSLVPLTPQALWNLVVKLRGRDASMAQSILSDGLAQLENNNKTDGLWVLAAQFQFNEKDFEKAQAALDTAEKMNAENADIQVLRAAIWAEKGEREKAISWLLPYVMKRPSNVELAFALFHHHMALQKTGAAREALTRLSPFVVDPSVRVRLMQAEASTYEQEQRFARALTAYQGALSLQPFRADLHYQVARMYEFTGRYSEALSMLQAGLRRDAPESVKRHEAWENRLKERMEQKVLDRDQLLLEANGE